MLPFYIVMIFYSGSPKNKLDPIKAFLSLSASPFLPRPSRPHAAKFLAFRPPSIPKSKAEHKTFYLLLVMK